MNLELVGRVAPVQLTVSTQLLSPLANFAHSSKVRSMSPFSPSMLLRALPTRRNPRADAHKDAVQ